MSSKRPILILVTEIFFALAIYLPSGVLELSQQPFHRGFFCNDQSLMHPFHKDTISTALVGTLSLTIPFAVILITEIIISRYPDFGLKTSASHPVCGRRCPGTVVAVFRYMLWLVFAVGANMLLTDTMKYSIGRLRPHFFAVCGFNPAGPNCTKGYIDGYSCPGAVAKHLKEARLSFPSGHASIAAASMVYCALYVHYRLRLRSLTVLKPFLQAVFLTLAVLCACSRVSDYKHHWSDVLAGFVLGTAVAVSVVFACTDLLACRKQLLVEKKSNGNTAMDMNNLGTTATVVNIP